MRAKPLAVLCLLAACQPDGDTASSSPGTSTITTAPPATSSSSTTGDASSTSSSSSTTSSGSDDSGPASSTTGVLDVGVQPDIGPPPLPCDGKIDLLFVISRDPVMELQQERLATAAVDFIETLEENFAGFDLHLMVVDGDAAWGDPVCEETCPAPQWSCEGYPCQHAPTVCDTTLGAGAIHNAGWFTENVPCPLPAGQRYITTGQPDLADAFSCIARVGTNGGNWLGAAAVAALSPDLVGPGGCNAGFLRKDALLMITFIGPVDDPGDSPGTPSGWAQKILDAKFGDPDAVLMFNIGALTCPPEDRICTLLDYFPRHSTAGLYINDYGPGFDEAVELVDDACAALERE